MKTLLFFLAASFALVTSCAQDGKSNSPSSVDAKTFSEMMAADPTGLVLDVRTPDEYSGGFLKGAVNIDWNGSDFEKQTSILDKSKTVFIYCLSGGRSRSAAKQLRGEGFSKVIELDGGMMKWRAAGLPEVKGAAPAAEGMSMDEYNNLLKSDKKVLIDFYAEWCGPCKKMAPFLEEIKSERSADLIIIRINSDENRTIVDALHIDALPTLMLYEKGLEVWREVGFQSKEDLLKKL